MAAQNVAKVPDAGELARALGGELVSAASHSRIRVGGRTLAYVNPRKAGFQLDLKAADLEDAPARLRKGLDVRGDRARLRVNGKGEAQARALLEYVRDKDGEGPDA